MISWKLLWQFVLIVTILIFIFMLIKFTVNGFKDLKEMFKNEK